MKNIKLSLNLNKENLKLITILRNITYINILLLNIKLFKIFYYYKFSVALGLKISMGKQVSLALGLKINMGKQASS